MSNEASATTKQTSEQDVEVQQEELQLPTDSESDKEQVLDNAQDLTASAGAAGADDALDKSAVSNVDTRLLQQSSQEGTATGGPGVQDSQESSASGGASGLESQQAGVTGSGSGTVSQQGGVSTESQQMGETGGVGRQLAQESTASTSGSGTDSQEGCGNGTESQLLGTVGGASRQNSKDSTATGISSNGNSFETAVASGSSVQASLESGVAGDVSNSPDTLENSAGTESFEGVATPAARDEFRENVEEKALETEELMRSYDQCFNKCACVCDYLRPCSLRIRKSKIFTFLKMLLLVIPISAFCMGLKYLSHCPIGNELPIFMMLMGIAGVILLSSSLGLDSRRVLCPSVRPVYFKALIIASRVMLLMVFAAGLDRTYSMSPSFDPSDHDKYCDEVFYNYAYYANFVVIGIAVLSFFIYVPSFNANIEGYEHL